MTTGDTSASAAVVGVADRAMGCSNYRRGKWLFYMHSLRPVVSVVGVVHGRTVTL